MRSLASSSIALLVCVSLTGCFLTSRRGGEEPDLDAGVDAEIVEDGDVRPEDDGGLDDGSDAAFEGGVDVPDASVEMDASSEGGTCDCVAAGPCIVASCDSIGGCMQSPIADGTHCESDVASVCFQGECVPRSCGDGYRETGEERPRESCDDGNAIEDDGCTSMCVAGVLVVDADPTGVYEVAPTIDSVALGVDGRDQALLAYVSESFDASELRCVRLSESGGQIGAPIVLQTSLPTPSQVVPAVAGLRDGGWVIAWPALRQGTYDIVFRTVSPAGTVSSERVANEARGQGQTRPTVTSYGAGFIIAWESSRFTEDDPDGGVYARMFVANGVPSSGDLRVPADASGLESNIRLSAIDDTWIAVYTHTGVLQGYEPAVRARRFTGTTPIDTADVSIGAHPTAAPCVSATASDEWLVAFESSIADAPGDVMLRRLPMSGAPFAEELAIATESSVAEHAPAVVGVPGNAYWSSFLEGSSPRLIASGNGAWSPDFEALRAAIEGDGVGRPIFALSNVGVWVGWRAFDADAPTYVFKLTLVRVP